MTIVAYKVGGSLLALPDLAGRLTRSFAQRPGSRPLLIVGGGATTDVVREWDRVHELGEERAHRLAMRSLDLSEALLLELLPEARLVTDHIAAQREWRAERIPLVHSRSVLDVEPSTADLPHSWRTTSDSIAAWIADRWKVDELVLMKSLELPPETTIPCASQTGLIDAEFPRLASRLPCISWVNLRADFPKFRTWRIPSKSEPQTK